MHKRPKPTKPWRDTLVVENAPILTHQAWEGGQYQLRLYAPEIATRALPGQFVHLQCSPERPLRRPLSIMLTDPAQGSIDLLYKTVGIGTHELSRRQIGESLSLIGPIGQPFQLHLPERPRLVMIGGGVGIPPILFLARYARQQAALSQPIVFMGSELPFPFATTTSLLMLNPPGLPDTATQTLALLEDWQIPARLSSLQGYRGCYRGFVSELAAHWLAAQTPDQRQQMELFCCGPHPLLAAVAALARRYQMPCQVSLEEFMACGVGGCAGCVVAVNTPAGTAMKRVCVDGPVFPAEQIFSATQTHA